MKTNESNLRKWQKKTNFGPNFDLFGPNWTPKLFSVGFTSTKCYTLLRAIFVCNFKDNMAKNFIFGPDSGPLDPNSSHKFFFSKIWLCQSLDIMVSYHHVQYQKKTNDPILRKLSKGRKDRQTDESDFIGHCPTNVEHPT